MRVSDVRRCSVSSATTRSLSSFFTASPPRDESSPHAGGLAEEVILVLRSASGRLLRLRAFGTAAASGLRRRACLRGYCFCVFLQFLDDPACPCRIDVNSGAHRTRQRDLTDV